MRKVGMDVIQGWGVQEGGKSLGQVRRQVFATRVKALAAVRLWSKIPISTSPSYPFASLI